MLPTGEKQNAEVQDFIEKIKSELVDIREDGSFLLNMKYFNYATGLTMTHDKKWEQLFGLKRRFPENDLTQTEANLAQAIQSVTEEIGLKLVKTALF